MQLGALDCIPEVGLDGVVGRFACPNLWLAPSGWLVVQDRHERVRSNGGDVVCDRGVAEPSALPKIVVCDDVESIHDGVGCGSGRVRILRPGGKLKRHEVKLPGDGVADDVETLENYQGANLRAANLSSACRHVFDGDAP